MAHRYITICDTLMIIHTDWAKTIRLSTSSIIILFFFYFFSCSFCFKNGKWLIKQNNMILKNTTTYNNAYYVYTIYIIQPIHVLTAHIHSTVWDSLIMKISVKQAHTTQPNINKLKWRTVRLWWPRSETHWGVSQRTHTSMCFAPWLLVMHISIEIW